MWACAKGKLALVLACGELVALRHAYITVPRPPAGLEWLAKKEPKKATASPRRRSSASAFQNENSRNPL